MSKATDTVPRRRTVRRALTPLVTLAVSAAASFAVAAAVEPTRPAPGPGLAPTHACTDPALAQVPTDREVNTVLDVEHGTMALVYLDVERGADRRYVIDYRDTECRARPNIRRHVDHAVAAWRQAQAEECADLAEFATSGRTTLRGVPVDPDALRTHLDRWC